MYKVKKRYVAGTQRAKWNEVGKNRALEEVVSWNKCAHPGCTSVPRRKFNGGGMYMYCPTHGRTENAYENLEGNMTVSLVADKYEELRKYLANKCYSWRADHSRYDDIIQNTLERLVREEQIKPFKDSRALWGRATNVVKEEIAQTFADRLPVSGVKFQAHWTATKALASSGGDPRAAYATQTGTSRVGRELIYAVAHGPSLYSPEYLQDLDLFAKDDVSSLSTQDEDNIRVAMYELTEQERKVVQLRMWMRLTNAQVGEELGLSAERVRKLWLGALRKLKPVLQASLSARYSDDM